MLPKIAAIQMASGPKVRANLMEASRLIREAANKGAQMVVLPESFALMAMHEVENIKRAERQGDCASHSTIQNTLKQCAIENKIWIVAGSIPLLSDKSESNNSEKVSAASLMFNDKGEIVARYNKIHLFDVDIQANNQASNQAKNNEDAQNDNGNKGNESYRESDTFEAGKDIVVVDTPCGKVGMSICYDLRFPMLYQEMVKQGAQVILVPSAFTYTTGEMHWEPLLKARAIETQCYVIAAAQGGFHVNGRRTYGHSMAIDYLGKTQALLEKGTGVITIDIDLQEQAKLRQSFPVLQHSVL